MRKPARLALPCPHRQYIGLKGELWNVSVRGQELTLRAASRSELLGRIERVLEAGDAVPKTEARFVGLDGEIRHAVFADSDITVHLDDRPVYRA